MVLSKREGIQEVFVIKAEAIDFFGALVKEQEGKSAVNGRIRFKDGARWYFNHPPEERDCLRKKMVALCEAIAGFYRTNVSHLKFNRVIGYEEFLGLLRAGKGGMN